MSIRKTVLGLIALVAIGATSVLTPSETRAQRPNHGQVVEGIARANAAHLALARKMASDPAFANAMTNAMSSGDYDAAAALVSTATGVEKSNVRASVKSSSTTGAGTEDEAADGLRLFHLASLESTPRAATFVWNFCLTFSFGGGFLTGLISCMTWPWG